MGKDLNGRELGTGFSQRKDGRYMFRKQIGRRVVVLYDHSLTKLRKKIPPEKKLEEKASTSNIRKPMTLNEWFDKWFEEVKSPMIKSDITRSTYKNGIKRTFLEPLGRKQMRDITQIDIQKTVNQAAANGYSEATIREGLSKINTCFKSAEFNDIISKNPCVDIYIKPMAKIGEGEPALTLEEEREFLQCVKGNFYEDLYYTMFATGMRIGEIMGLQVQDVDFENRMIHIKRQFYITYYDGKRTEGFTTPKSKAGLRDIPFLWDVEKHLKRQIENRPLPSDKKYANFVFLTRNGNPLLRHSLNYPLKSVVRKIERQRIKDAIAGKREYKDFPHIHPHLFRHTFCTRLFENHIDPVVIRAIMGHESYNVTLRYTHISNKIMNKELLKLEKISDTTE